MKNIKIVYLIACSLFLSLLLNGCATDRLQGRLSFENAMEECWGRIRTAKGDNLALNETLNKEIFAYQQVLEEMLVTRGKTLKLATVIRENYDNQTAIPPRMLDELNLTMKEGLTVSGKVEETVASNECWIQATDEKLKSQNLPSIDSHIRLKGSMFSLSATLTLYDTFLTNISVLNEHDRIRTFLNQSDIGYGIQSDQLTAINDAALSISNLLFVREQIAFYKKMIPTVDEHNRDDEFKYLQLSIEQSPAFGVMQSDEYEKVQERVGVVQANEISDNFSELNRRAVNGVSEFFGNLVGLVEERKGKLYADKKVEQIVLEELKAGDILLEKTPFRLTDKMIPGHWGHAAIWIGTEQELKQLGIWDHYIVKKYHKQIQGGHGVVEALRDGVTMSTIAHFLNIDDLGIIREPKLSEKEVSYVIIRTLRQVGKAYDFNYDVETTDKIVCSQLVYLAYTDISWPTDKIVGRYTISPDNIAFKAINNGPLSLEMFYHDGELVESDALVLMDELMKPDD